MKNIYDLLNQAEDNEDILSENHKYSSYAPS